MSSSIRVGMNRPTVKSPEAVRGILERYDVRPELQVVAGSGAGTGALAFVKYEDMLVRWPSAVPADEMPAWDDNEPDDVQWEAEYEVHDERGEQGLTDLLLALAPYLTSALVLQAAFWESDGSYFTAREWTVKPGGTEVEVKDIGAMEDEYSIGE